jgi:hypothetical protein
MHAAENLALTRAEPLSWTEICERYADQWVCFIDVEDDAPIEWALVVAHDRSLDEALAQVATWSVGSVIAYAHTGRTLARQ